jgi:uncharacterized caspase-like protein
MPGITQSGSKHAWLRVFAIGAILAAVVIAPPMGWAQQSGERLALLIGNASYPDANTPLISTKDAHALAEELRRNRFKVDLKENLGKVDMSAALATFVEKIGPGTVALFYFGGYGLQLGKQTYLLPVNAQIWSEPDIAREGTRLEEVLAALHRKGASIKIVIIDAARRNDYERRVRRGAMGLAAVRVPDNALIMYSTGPDKLVNENNAPWALTSLFMNELIKELRVPNARAEEVFNLVRQGVSQASLMEQIPWVSSSLVSPFSFSSAGPISPQPSLPGLPLLSLSPAPLRRHPLLPKSRCLQSEKARSSRTTPSKNALAARRWWSFQQASSEWALPRASPNAPPKRARNMQSRSPGRSLSESLRSPGMNSKPSFARRTIPATDAGRLKMAGRKSASVAPSVIPASRRAGTIPQFA